MLLGVALALFGFAMDTSVHSIGTYVAGSFVGGGDTYNLGLLQRQMMVFQTGLALFVAGAVFYARVEEPANSQSATAKAEWVEPESIEEREERAERDRKRAVITLALIGVTAAALLFLLNWTAPDPYDTTNIDENLVTNDMNEVLDANLSK